MAIIPAKRSLTASAYDILNAIRNNATTNYKNFVPPATDTKSLRQIGTIMMEYQDIQNEFLTALWNRIGRVILSSKMYENPWSMFKLGQLDFGETVEEIFTNIAQPFEYNPEQAEQTIYKRQIPDVRSAFHVMNYQKFYKTTTSQEQLRQAFLSEGGVDQLLTDIISSLLKAANYDEFQVMKYLLFRNILNGRLYPKEVSPVTTANMKSIIADVKSISNKMVFLKPDYNVAGVQTTSEKNDQFILIDTDFQAHMDVEVLASAFNMNKAEFMGHIVPIDGFGELDTDRLNILFRDDGNYVPITQEQLQALSIIPCVLVDRSYFMIFDNLIENTQKFNEEGLYWNYWLHTWKTFSVSPFANAVMFLPATPSVISVAVSPDSATITAGSSIQLTPTVTVENFAPQTVKYESDSDTIVVSDMGVVTALEGASGSATITVTSTFDPTKLDTMTVTIA